MEICQLPTGFRVCLDFRFRGKKCYFFDEIACPEFTSGRRKNVSITCPVFYPEMNSGQAIGSHSYTIIFLTKYHRKRDVFSPEAKIQTYSKSFASFFMPLNIIYKDEYLIAINKPPGLLVHRSPIAKYATEFAVQSLRDQIGQLVFPVHRLDRKTSGVLLFALTTRVNSKMQQLFSERKIVKKYHAIVRGYSPKEERITYALVNEKGTAQDAVTDLKTLEQFEINIPFGKHTTSRYSYVELVPETGRFHQLRKHTAHIFHPIIGDRPHGCNKQNRLWKEKWSMTRMLLHASELLFDHPILNKEILINANFDKTFLVVLEMLRKENLHQKLTGSV